MKARGSVMPTMTLGATDPAEGTHRAMAAALVFRPNAASWSRIACVSNDALHCVRGTLHSP